MSWRNIWTASIRSMSIGEHCFHTSQLLNKRIENKTSDATTSRKVLVFTYYIFVLLC